MTAEATFVRVYELPAKLTNGFCARGPVPIAFANVDWFEATPHQSRHDLEVAVRRRPYFRGDRAFLVLADDPSLTFTIGKVTR